MFTRLESNPVLGFLTGFLTGSLTGFLYFNGCTITAQTTGDAMGLSRVILDYLPTEANKKITGLNPVRTTRFVIERRGLRLYHSVRTKPLNGGQHDNRAGLHDVIEPT